MQGDHTAAERNSRAKKRRGHFCEKKLKDYHLRGNPDRYLYGDNIDYHLQDNVDYFGNMDWQ